MPIAPIAVYCGVLSRGPCQQPQIGRMRHGEPVVKQLLRYREDRGVGSDGERQRDDGNGSKAWAFAAKCACRSEDRLPARPTNAARASCASPLCSSAVSPSQCARAGATLPPGNGRSGSGLPSDFRNEKPVPPPYPLRGGCDEPSRAAMSEVARIPVSPARASSCALRFRLQNAANDSGHAVPILGLGFQPSPAGARQPVVLGAAIVLAFAPRACNHALMLRADKARDRANPAGSPAFRRRPAGCGAARHIHAAAPAKPPSGSACRGSPATGPSAGLYWIRPLSLSLTI